MESTEDNPQLVSNPKYFQFAKKCKKFTSDPKNIEIHQSDLYKFINDDVCARFMTARDDNEEKAFLMWEGWAKWRCEFQPDKIDEYSIINELKSGKCFIHGFDKSGRP